LAIEISSSAYLTGKRMHACDETKQTKIDQSVEKR
jgi:hypothetical protein